jgi:hypothetical protein
MTEMKPNRFIFEILYQRNNHSLEVDTIVLREVIISSHPRHLYTSTVSTQKPHHPFQILQGLRAMKFVLSLEAPVIRLTILQTWNYGQQNVANNASSSPAFLTNTPYYQPPPQTYETPQGTFQVSHNQEYFAIPTTTVVYVGSIAPVYPRIPATTYMSVPPSMLTPLPHLDTMSSTNKCMSQGTVQPEARKIIITKLSHDIKDSELGTLVRRACSKYRPRTQSEQDHPIHSVDLPRYPGGKPKGHAFVIFDSQALAEHTVSSLDGSKFQGRSLGAKLAKEGVEPVGGYGNIEGLSQYPMGPPQCIEEMNNGSGNSNPQKPSGKIEKARTLVVHGDGKGKKSEKKDSAKGKESSPETKSKEKDKENRQPLVVDGSGRHRR